MNNSEIKEIALKQSAEDIGCQAHDFLSDKNVIVPFCLEMRLKAVLFRHGQK